MGCILCIRVIVRRVMCSVDVSCAVCVQVNVSCAVCVQEVVVLKVPPSLMFPLLVNFGVLIHPQTACAV